MGIKLVQRDDVRKYAKISASDTTNTNDILDYIIEGVSEMFQKIAARGCEQKVRTEYFDIEAGKDRLYLGGWPVESSPVIDIRQDTLRAWGSTTAVATTNYYLDAARGIVLLLQSYPAVDYSVKVVYTGGAAKITSPTAGQEFWTLYPDAANAIIQQCVYEYNNLKVLGKREVDLKDSRTTTHGKVKLLPLTRSVAMNFGRGPVHQ